MNTVRKNHYETESLLSNIDMMLLKAKKGRKKVVFILLLFYIIALAITQYLIINSYIKIPLLVLITIGFISILIYIFKVKKNGLISEKYKRIIRSELLDKFQQTKHNPNNNTSETEYFFILGNGENVQVSITDYYKFLTGDFIEIQATKKNNIILSINSYSNDQNSFVLLDNKATLIRTKTDGFPFIEQLEDMSEEELGKVRKNRNKRVISAISWSMVAGFVFYWALTLLYTIIIFGVLKIKNSIAIEIGLITMDFAIVAFILWINYQKVHKYFKDLEYGKKMILSAIIEDKAISNVKIISKRLKILSSIGLFHYLIINGKYLPVNKEIYQSVETGHPVKLHQTYYAEMPIKIEYDNEKIDF